MSGPPILPSKSSSVSSACVPSPLVSIPAERRQFRQRLRPTRDADPHFGQMPVSFWRGRETEALGELMQGERERIVDRVSNGCKAKIRIIANIFVHRGVNCSRKTAKRTLCGSSIRIRKFPWAKFLRNSRNLTTDDTARLCRNQHVRGKKIFASGDVFGLWPAILRAKTRKSDFSASYFAALSAAQR